MNEVVSLLKFHMVKKPYTNTTAAKISKQDVSMTHVKQADQICSQSGAHNSGCYFIISLWKTPKLLAKKTEVDWEERICQGNDR